jgi:ribosomal protein L37AE/L43A
MKYSFTKRSDREAKLKNERTLPCKNCRGNLWHTLKKGSEWACRYCGVIRKGENASI